MKINASPDLTSQPDLPSVRTWATIILRELVQVINGKLDLKTNVRANIKEVTFTGASTTVSVLHQLGRVPEGYLVVGKSAAIHVFDGSKANTDELLYVQASAAGSAKLWIF